MNDMNEIRVTGKLTRDPEVRSVGKESTPLAKFSIAINKYIPPRQKGGEGREEVSYVDVEAWRAAAEACAGLAKGDSVMIAGQIKQERWEDAKTGDKRSKLLIVAERVAREARPAKKDAERGERRPSRREEDERSEDDAPPRERQAQKRRPQAREEEYEDDPPPARKASRPRRDAEEEEEEEDDAPPRRPAKGYSARRDDPDGGDDLPF